MSTITTMRRQTSRTEMLIMKKSSEIQSLFCCRLMVARDVSRSVLGPAPAELLV